MREHRDDRKDAPFDIVVGGMSPPDTAEADELISSLAEEGVTWWDERQRLTSADVDRLAPTLRRIEAGATDAVVVVSAGASR